MSDLEAVAEALADGTDIDWAAIDPAGDEERRAALRTLGALFAAFRDLQCETAERATPPADGSPSNRWGPLLIHQEIGRGASSVVFHAVDSRLGRDVALKVVTGLDALPSDLASVTSAAVVEEGRLLARVRQHNVVTVFGADVFDGRVGIWMELLHGRTLEQLVQDQGPFSAIEAASIGVDVCGALSAIHRAGLLHRDVKTQNVMRERGGRIVLMDLGASAEAVNTAAAGGTSLAGTPLYMAPELFDGASSSVQSDIYSLGVLLFRLVTASFPVQAATLAEVKQAHQSKRSGLLADARSDLPPGFHRLVSRCLETNPPSRFDSAGALQHELMAFLKERDDGSVRELDAETSQVAKRNHAGLRWWSIALLVAAGIAVGAVATTLLVGDWQNGTLSTNQRLLTPTMKEQLDIAFAFEDLAGSVAAKGDWLQAAAHYEQARQVYLANVDPDAPLVALGHAKKGWALFQAGKLEDARFNLEVALYLLDQELGVRHPQGAVVLMGLAGVHQARGDHREASRCVALALERRRQMLISLGLAVPAEVLPAEAALLAASPMFLAVHDGDGDWIPDLIEASLRLDAHRADSDEVVVDGRASSGSSSNPAKTALAISYDPTAVIAHGGAKDPELVGFRQWRPFVGASAGDAGWKVRVDVQSYYYAKLTAAQKARAAQRGFRTTTVFAAHEGTGFVIADLGMDGRRWDVGTAVTDGRAEVRTWDTVTPLSGSHFPLTGTRSPLLELVYEPDGKTARLLADGHPRITDYRGHQQFIENWGFMFGASNTVGSAPRGDIDFFLAVMEIH